MSRSSFRPEAQVIMVVEAVDEHRGTQCHQEGQGADGAVKNAWFMIDS